MSQYGPEAGEPSDGFKAFLATFPWLYARPFVRKYFRSLDDPDGRARFAPYSLRKIEASLGRALGRGEVAVCHPDRLGDCIGARTEAVGITTMDPLGMGYVSVTYNPLFPFGRESITAREFGVLMRRIRSLKEKRRFKVLVGGEGTWQVERSGRAAALGIDALVYGRSDAEIAATFEAVIAGRAPSVVRLFRRPNGPADEVPPITAPAIYGDVEITRGCGRGCAFCSPNLARRFSVPLEDVMKEVEVNVGGGTESVFAVTDDLFLYGADESFRPNRGAVVGLFETIAGFPGVRWIHLSHASLAPALTDRALLPELAPVLVAKSAYKLRGKRYATVEVGLESGSVEIMRRYMGGKALPLKIGDWPRIVAEGVAHFNENTIYPLGTIVVGWPGETERDTMATAGLIESLHAQGLKLFYTPVLFVPIERTPLEEAEGAGLDGLSGPQLSLIERCWEYNVGLFGSEVPGYWLRIVGLGAKAVGVWRRLTARQGAIHDKLGSFLLRTKIPCDPGLCD